MRHLPVLAAIVSLGLLAAPAGAADFGFSFEWGDIRLCTNGRPNRVPNPVFRLRNVPQGTATIRFTMKDRNVPTYRHGGGKARYTGSDTIAPGAFKYKSPCPPNGRHTYVWTATALDGNGRKLATATAYKQYP
ncbi:MAG: hypothetical protein Kow0026_17920 [Oricola sp.]